MLTKDIRTTIDNARDVLVGKIPNPQAQIEQITTAMIYKFMDDMDLDSIKYGGDREFFKGELEQYAWSKIMSPQLGNEARMNLYTEALEQLPLSAQIPELFRRIFKGSFLPFRDSQTLSLFLKEINELSYDNSENLGNAFEYLLSIMSSQGDAGQFRTPRNIIDFIVDVVDPKKTDTILDPACGTAGFLISAYKHILKHNSKAYDPAKNGKLYAGKNADTAKNIDIEIEDNLRGDLLTNQEKMDLAENISGYDISPDMQRLALVNLYLHGFKSPKIFEYDTLTSLTKWDEYYDVILANPPFMTPKGGIQPHNRFGVQANRSEVLFVDYIMEHLNRDGRAGVIVPEGIVFQSANAYKALRKKLVDDGYLYAVVSLPSGIFQPYSGVKTSILLMDRQLARRNNEILFVNVQNDGYDLGANRRQIDKNDLPDAFEIIREWQKGNRAESKLATYATKEKVAGDGEYNLTASRYAEAKDYSGCKWDMIKLKDVCEVVRGGSPRPIQDYITEDKNGLNWLRIGDIEEGGKYIYKTTEKIKPEGLSKTRLVKEGDFILSNSMSFGRPYIMKTEACIHDGWLALQNISSALKKEFLYLVLSSEAIKEEFLRYAAGSTVKNLKIETVKEVEIPLPPLEVQEEIVKELDAYQQVIDGAKKVVESWKPTIPVNPKWERVKLGDVCKPEYGYTDTAKDAGDARFIRITDINDFGKLRSEDPKYINSTKESDNYVLNKNDLLVARTGATYGKTMLFKEDYKAVFASFLIRLNFDKTKVYNPYYWAFAQSHNYWEQAKLLVSGGGQPQFNGNAIVNIEFYLPPLEEQKEIVAKIEIEEQAVEQCKTLIKIHEEKIANKIKSVWGEGCE